VRPSGGPVAPRVNRIIVLCAVAFLVAIAVHTMLGLAGIGADRPIRLLVTPLIGAAIIYFGLPGYPTAGRIRLAAMVGVGLLLIAGMV
jgi:hypothetical protein